MDMNLKKKETSTVTRNRVTTRDLAQTGLLVALVFIATYFINFRLPFASEGGLVHMGNVMLFAAAIVFGPKKGAIAGAFGMGLFDILSGWAIWAPFTFIIRGVMGWIVGSVAYSNGNNGQNMVYNIVGTVISGVWMIAGYYTSEVILYKNWIIPFGSIPGDITQLVFGIAIGVPLAAILKRVLKRANLV